MSGMEHGIRLNVRERVYRARQQPVVKALSEHAECMQIGFEQRLLLLALIDVLFA